MKSLLKRIIRKMWKRILPQDEVSIRRRNARRKGFFLRFHKEPYVYVVGGVNSKFYIPLYKTDYIQQRIITENNYYEADDLNYICKKWHQGVIGKSLKNGLVLDVGANIGNHTLYFCNECEVACVHCFEPITSTYAILKKNIEINNLVDRVVLHCLAIGEKSGKAKVAVYDKNNIGATYLTIDRDGGIPMICIDDMTFDRSVSLIKIDVEGFEMQAIRGCLKTIEKDKPYIMIEIRDEFKTQIQSLLSSYNYKFEQLSGINYLLYT